MPTFGNTGSGTAVVTANSVGDLIIKVDNVDFILTALEQALLTGLEKVGLTCESYAKQLCPVDTGRLRNSITNQLTEKGHAVIVGTNVEYAKYVELNEKAQHENGQAHYLHDAANNHVSKYREIIKNELENA